MKRKIVTLLVTSLVLGASLCACGESNTDTKTNASNGTSIADDGANAASTDDIANGDIADDDIADVADTDVGDDAPDGIDDAGNAIVNPMQESTIEDIEKKSGKTTVVPDGLEVVSVYEITYGDTIYEIMLNDGADEYIYRFQKTTEYQDISGMYFDWDEDYTVDSANNATTEALYYYGVTNNGEGAATWYDGTWSYSISMDNGATADKLNAMYKMLAE